MECSCRSTRRWPRQPRLACGTAGSEGARSPDPILGSRTSFSASEEPRQAPPASRNVNIIDLRGGWGPLDVVPFADLSDAGARWRSLAVAESS
jgi:hypothetical protein